MKVKLKKLRDQTIVITGASSGIGLATARMAAQKGAKVMLAARSSRSLQKLTDEINGKNRRQAAYIEADVGDQEDVRAIARAAIERFGGFDTWINNAGIGMYGKLEEIPIADMRKLFDTNFWGLVYGSLEAAQHLKRRGGALINVGSTESERALPLQGIYAASKHAVKGFTDVLRMELEADAAPVSVTLIKPGAIDTPFSLNAKNYLASEPQHVPPVYAPEAVAEAILHCAETPVRDLFVGGGGKGNAAMGHYAPGLADKYGEKFVMPGTESGKPPSRRDALDQPSEKLQERGNYPGHVAQSSDYTRASLHPLLTGVAALTAGFVLRSWWRANYLERGSKSLHWSNPYRPERSTRSSLGGGEDRAAGSDRERRQGVTERSQIREHMQVCGSDGKPIGRVDGVEGDRIRLTRESADAPSHYIEIDAVTSVQGDVLSLNETADEVKHQWQ